MIEAGQIESALTTLMVANGGLAIVFGLLAKRSFRSHGRLTPALGIWSGVAMHGHALMTFGISWIDRGSLYGMTILTALIGLILAASGIAVIGAGRRAYGNVARVYGLKEDLLIETGIYRRTRNPQYLGYVLLLVGSAVASGSLLAFIFAAIFFIVIHLGVVLVEEPHLKRIFGTRYVRYAKQVGRYMGSNRLAGRSS